MELYEIYRIVDRAFFFTGLFLGMTLLFFGKGREEYIGMAMIMFFIAWVSLLMDILHRRRSLLSIKKE